MTLSGKIELLFLKKKFLTALGCRETRLLAESVHGKSELLKGRPKEGVCKEKSSNTKRGGWPGAWTFPLIKKKRKKECRLGKGEKVVRNEGEAFLPCDSGGITYHY